MKLQDHFLSSMTRILDPGALESLEVTPLPRPSWTTGDYVAVEITDPGGAGFVELPSGRLVELVRGDVVVGALGVRHATLEATGSWEAVGEEGNMHLLTAGGLLGKCLSRSTLVPALPSASYMGHLVRSGDRVTMKGAVDRSGPEVAYTHPTILIIGSSMSAGKTTAARVLIRRMRSMGMQVLGAKVTGAGRYRDVLAMGDAGASPIFDFVDVGLPSTVCPEDEFREALKILLSRMAGEGPDVAVVESGASPLEPYNGTIAVKELRSQVRMTVLCASDPYSVLGMREAFGLELDLITGPASNTMGGVDLMRRLIDVPCLDVRDPATAPELDALLRRHLTPGARPTPGEGTAAP